VNTAKAYGNEEGIGSGLQVLFEEGTAKREELFVTSKLWMTITHHQLFYQHSKPAYQSYS